MSPTKTRGGEAGYTLLELLIVLAIIGMIVTAAPMIYQRLFPAYQTRHFAADLAVKLRSLREDARKRDEVARVSFALAGSSLQVGDQLLTAPEGTNFTYVPKATSAGFSNTLLFFPSGASSGGKIEVKRENLTINIEVDWISGAVEVKQ